MLYGCEIWSLTLREHRFRAFENEGMRRIFRPKKKELSCE
jgi:hypothetical protein